MKFETVSLSRRTGAVVLAQATVWVLILGLSPFQVQAQMPPVLEFFKVTYRDNHECLINLRAEPNQKYDLQISTDLAKWTSLGTIAASTDPYLAIRGPSLLWVMDSGAISSTKRFYRAVKNIDPTAILGDHLVSNDGELITFSPVHHGTVVLKWGKRTIYADPSTDQTGLDAAMLFRDFPSPDLIVITHIHSDHYDPVALQAIVRPTTRIIAPQNVFDAMPAPLRALTTAIANGGKTQAAGVDIEAIPAYNLIQPFHPKGRDNGYVLTMGGKRIYIAGDTEDTPEMRALKNIDIAFLSMNLPFSMEVSQAARAVREFKPKIVYPYHFVNASALQAETAGTLQDVRKFKRLVGTDLGIEVRLRPIYTSLQ